MKESSKSIGTCIWRSATRFMEGINSKNFSDMVLSVGSFSLRVEDDLVPAPSEFHDELRAIYEKCKNAKKIEGEPDFRVIHDDQPYRCVEIEYIEGVFYVLRKISKKILNWKELRLPHLMISTTLEQGTGSISKGGIIFVIGKTNSGKSTTINALIDEMARHKSWMFMCYEDPVEVEFDPSTYDTGAEIIQSTVSSSELAKALKIALRANADVIKVGEIRDRDAAQMAIDAAIAGHMVLTTLHGSTLEEGLSRFSKWIGDDYLKQFASAFRCAIYQKLEQGSGINNRMLELKYLAKSQASVNTIAAGNFQGLNQQIDSHTKKYVEGRSLER